MLGKTASVSTVVDESNTARAVGSGSLEVFATPMLVALMERAACACLAEDLEPGQSSVGTHMCVDHTAASPLGMKITATAKITSVSRRSIEFSVTARDAAGEIGSGRHIRVIIDTQRFMTKVHAKGGV